MRSGRRPAELALLAILGALSMDLFDEAGARAAHAASPGTGPEAAPAAAAPREGAERTDRGEA